VSEAVFFSVVIVVAVAGVLRIQAGRAVRATVSLIALVVFVICLWVPAHLQAAGLIDSKLAKAGFVLPPSDGEIGALSARWAIELAVIAAVEWACWQGVRARATPAAVDLVDRDRSHEFTAVTLVAIGVVATILFPAPSIEDRADGGQGLGTLLRTFLIVGLAYLVYFRAFGKARYWVVAAAGTILLVAGNVRSPLLVIACGYLASELSRGRLRRGRRLVVLVVLVVAFAAVGSLMSNFRANITREYGYSTAEVIQQTAENPWIAPYEAGLDTLDGYRFSERLSHLEPARPWDILNVVTTFVPRAVWPEKPDDISVQMSAKYLHYRASGQFLSPVGYLTLLVGSYPGALVALAVVTALLVALVRRTWTSFGYAIVLCVIIRFMIGGSSFDFYYGLTLAVPVVVVLGLRSFLRAAGGRHLPGTVTFLLPGAVVERPRSPRKAVQRVH
jgi:hypothetical protein